MKTRSVLLFTVLRLLAFIVPLVVLMLAGVAWWISAPLAALFGLAFSFVFLRTPREQVSTALYEARHPSAPVTRDDEQVEDAFVDATDASTPAATAIGTSEGEGESQADAHHK